MCGPQFKFLEASSHAGGFQKPMKPPLPTLLLLSALVLLFSYLIHKHHKRLDFREIVACALTYLYTAANKVYQMVSDNE